jgi:outer membrane protein assembly factor BamB
MLYQQGYDGYMHAINTTTGVQQWVSITQPGGLEMPEPGYPASASIVAGQTMANGVVYTSTTKSYETQPAYRGHTLFAYNTATGKQIWNISGEYTAIEIADGILIGFNGYDGREYAFGPGPSATTVTAPMTQLAAGTPMIIQGTVTDQTPGIAMGTPVVSDQWMGQWEEYLYMDQPYPTQATGVNVVITAIDPNHNLITIGNATSDISGTFGYQWTPPNVSGKYTIIATFNADNSYYGSCGETTVTVGSASAATPAPTATPTSVADMYFVPAIAGLAVLIIVGLIVLALLVLRKRA